MMVHRRPITLLAASLALLLAACSADVSGSVYVTMRSGDVRRGADVRVVLVREQFVSQWTDASATFRTSFEQARSAHEDAITRSQRATEEYLRGVGTRYVDRRHYDEATERRVEAARRMDAVRKEWLDHTATLIQRATVAAVRTDMNGYYEFKGVPRGKYYLVANHKVFEKDLFWAVPIEVRRTHTLDLSNSNSSSPLDPIRTERDVTTAATPTSPPALREPPHQPKWLAEELAKEKQEAQVRQAIKGTWHLVHTVYRRRMNTARNLENALDEILRNPDRFQSQAVVATSLVQNECRLVASQTANAARTWRDRRFDREDGVVLVQSDREAADTSGWTTRPRIEESVTVRMWSCGNTVSEAKSP